MNEGIEGNRFWRSRSYGRAFTFAGFDLIRKFGATGQEVPIRIYLAGPDVFRPDARKWADDASALLARHGQEALLPLDSGETTASGIYAANIALIRSADALVANLNPFRGFEPDSGTCFEIGYAVALGKPVVGYLADTRTLVEKITDRPEIGAVMNENGCVDSDGWLVEDFGMPVNLMLGIPGTIVAGGLEQALFALMAR